MNQQIDINDLPCIVKGRKFFRNLLTFYAILIIIFLVIISFVGKGVLCVSGIIYDIIIGIVSGTIPSIGLIIFSYYKFLKKIPTETKEKIDRLLNERLGYETSNHNGVMAALNPSNSNLSDDHREIRADLNSISTSVEAIKSQRQANYNLLDDSGERIVRNIDSLSDFSVLFVDLYRKNTELTRINGELQANLFAAQRQNKQLAAENARLKRSLASTRGNGRRSQNYDEEMPMD